MSPLITVCILIVYIVLVSVLTDSSEAARLPDIYWNSTNPIFRIDNTDHIIDVNRGNVAYEYDQVNIVCPVYPSSTRVEDTESYIIYNVSKEEYDTCHIVNRTVARTIAICDKPFSNRYFTVTFRPFTPQPGGLEFKSGQDYYFISLNSLTHSPQMCHKHHMKVVFKVCCKRGQVIPPAQRSATTSSTTTAKPVSPSATPRLSPPSVRYQPPSVNVSNGSNRSPDSNHVRHKDRPVWYLGINNSANAVHSSSARPGAHLLVPHTKSPAIQSSTAQTPYWWRPHFTKLPETKLKNSADTDPYNRGSADQGYASKKKDIRDKSPNDTREKSDGLNSSADMSSPIRTIIIIITINLFSFDSLWPIIV